MPLQNRVDPFSNLVASRARGMFTGNRGCLHDDQKAIVRDWRSNAWITCVLTFKDRKRAIMRAGEYTHLFFLDEATALAAGHRPCAECRRADYDAYRAAIARTRRSERMLADDLNRALMDEMGPALREGRRAYVDAQLLPPGAMFAVEGEAFLVLEEGVRLWSFDRYGPLRPFPQSPVMRLTPQASIDALEGGYAPVLHESAPTA